MAQVRYAQMLRCILAPDCEIAATFKTVDFPFIIGYEIENNKIISHWMLADQMSLMEQLGLFPPPLQHIKNIITFRFYFIPAAFGMSSTTEANELAGCI